MTQNNKKDIAHSTFQRLLNKAKEKNSDFNLLLTRYGMERLLYRLSISDYQQKFILKGASLFLVWKGQDFRVTRDADFLSFGKPDLYLLENTFKDICLIDCDTDDGIVFLPESVKVAEIRENQEYDGIGVLLTGTLKQAKIPLQIDIGFGDIVTPEPESIEYPTLLENLPPKLLAYPKYTLIAEKFEAMVHLGIANSRMKDFFDIFLLTKLFDFDGELLAKAISNTFERRKTELPTGIPYAFTESFYEDAQKQVQWKAFLRKSKPDVEMGELPETIEKISGFILPVVTSLVKRYDFNHIWHPDIGWEENLK